MKVSSNQYLKLSASYLALILLGLWFYYPVLGFDYIWDDTLIFVDKVSLLNEPLSWELLAQPVLFGTTYFRPLVFFSWFLEFQLFGQSPFISHLINLIVFLFNTLLVYSLARRLLLPASNDFSLKAFLAALVYATHPALIEPTAWVSGRFDLFATCFILLSSVVFLSKRMRPWLKLLIVSVSYLMALFSKELGIVTPVVLFCLWMAVKGVGVPITQAITTFFRENWLLIVALLAFTVVYFVLRSDAMGSVYHRAFDWHYIKTAYFTDYMPFRAFLFYLWRAVVPFHSAGALHPYDGYFSDSFGLVASIAVLIGAMTVMARGAIKNYRPVYWVLWSGFICIFLVLHIIPLSIGQNLGHDRFMASALAFFIIAVFYPNYPAILQAMGAREKVSVGILGVILVSWFGMTSLTHSVFLKIWSNEYALWQESYRVYPDFKAARYNYVYSALKSGRLDEAEKVLLLINEKEGFGFPEQALFGDLLVRKGDPEGLNYLEGYVASLPAFHESDLSIEVASLFHVTPKQIGGVYSSLANAVIIFSGDLEKARYYNEISSWYLEKGETVPLKYQLAAIQFLEGRFDQSGQTLDSITMLSYSGRNELARFFMTLVSKYCRLDSPNPLPCQEFENKGEQWRAIVRKIGLE